MTVQLRLMKENYVQEKERRILKKREGLLPQVAKGAEHQAAH